MIDISNTHFRYFIRLITARAQVYTEMLHHDAVLHNHAFLLPFSPQEHPIVLQLGGSDPPRLAEAALLGQQYGYDQINLNVGCPSPRVQKGSFGACLMKEAGLVRECMEAMAKAVSIPCTVKCRLGVDEFDSYEFLVDFIKEVSGNSQGPIRHFVIHARKAFLKGLNPAQNRTIPPLIYERVYRLKEDFPALSFEINGGIKNVGMAKGMVDGNNLQGCMVGRMAYENPFELMHVDHIFYGETPYTNKYESDAQARRTIMLQYADYIERLEAGEVRGEFGHPIRKPNPSVLVKPIINFYNGENYSGKYRQYLSDLVKLKSGPLHVIIRNAAELMWTGGFKTKRPQRHLGEGEGEAEGEEVGNGRKEEEKGSSSDGEVNTV